MDCIKGQKGVFLASKIVRAPHATVVHTFFLFFLLFLATTKIATTEKCVHFPTYITVLFHKTKR